MTSKKEEAAKPAPAPEPVDVGDLATPDQAEAQKYAKEAVERLAKDRNVEGAPDPYEEAHEMAEKVVERQHEAQTVTGPTADD